MHHGLIWVWPESGPDSFIESAATPIVTCPDLENEDPVNPGVLLFRIPSKYGTRFIGILWARLSGGMWLTGLAAKRSVLAIDRHVWVAGFGRYYSPKFLKYTAGLAAEHSVLAIDRYVHDMPCSLDTVIENISDQSHVPWAHHGVAGDRHVQRF